MAKKRSKGKRKNIETIIEIPQEIEAELKGNKIKLSKGAESTEKKLSYPVKIEDKKIIIRCEKPSKKAKKLINTTAAHIRNMISGLQKKYVYKMQIASVHFPITVNVSGKEFIIKNFLGETKDRKAKILEGVDVKVEGDMIKIESIDKEKAGQTAANIETCTKIKARDRRIFQDGIYITEKEKGRRRK